MDLRVWLALLLGKKRKLMSGSDSVLCGGLTSFLPPPKHLLCSAPGSPGRHLPRAAAAPGMTDRIRPGRMESRAIYCCLTGCDTDLNTPAF